MRTFQLSDAKSHKFWNIDVKGNAFTVTFGKIGATGQTKTKTFGSPAAARAEADKLVKEKTKKGYTETTPKIIASDAEAFETSLRANPDDLAGWCAYADYLTEQGNPQGEFMQTQIALEDEARSKDERDQLKAREAELLAAHEREWLGELAACTLDAPDEDPDAPFPRVEYRWRRGFITEIDVQCVTIGLGQAIAASPATRLVQTLRIRGSEHYHSMTDDGHEPRALTPAGADEHYGYFELIGAPCLESLRVLRAGDDEDEPVEDGWCDCHCSLRGLEHLIAATARVEELHLFCKGYDLNAFFASPALSHLRVLRAYHLGGYAGRNRQYEYPLNVLAANPALANLTHLQFHPHFAREGDGDENDLSYLPLEQVRLLVNAPHLKKLTHLQLRLSDMGDDGIREIITSGILKRLVWLDLRHGCVTDEGAELLAHCADAKKLERIDLSRNAVTATGLAALRKANVNAVANRPLTEEELNSREYLREGDFE